MLELLAAIQSADPPSLVLWGLFVFAAGMYPIGFMLGASCSPCCGTPCPLCETGDLPDTVTVTFNGLQDTTQGPDLITLSISACFGSGAAARVTAPGGDPETDKGPISAVSLTNGGSGYAKLGRVAPTLSVSGGSGSGAAFTPTITSSDDACGIPSWSIASVSVKGGTGYVDGETLTVTAAEGDTEDFGATVVVNTTRTEPTVTASATGGGSGATFGVTLSQNPGTPLAWSVSALSLTNGGSGYPASGSIAFNEGPGDTETESASAYYTCGRSQPTVVVEAIVGGNSATLSPTLTSTTDWEGNTYWYVSAISVTVGGSGYSYGDPIALTVTDGQAGSFSYFNAFVSEVDEDGAILAITVEWGGEYFKNTGVISSVTLWWGGSYHRDDGIPTSVTVSSGGQYYREDASEPPYVATVTVTVFGQQLPSEGTGATFSATVNDNTSSPTFGRITGLTIEDGGTGYLAWKWLNSQCCKLALNGAFVLQRRQTQPCLYTHSLCTGNGPIQLSFSYEGPTAAARVGIQNALSFFPLCNTTFLATESVSDCSNWPGGRILATAGAASATVTPGGTYDAFHKNPAGVTTVLAEACNVCCQGSGLYAGEIELELTDNRDGGELSGTYVLPGPAFDGLFQGFFPDVAIAVTHVTCGRAAFPPGWVDDDFGDNFCFTKCRTLVNVSPVGDAGYLSFIPPSGPPCTGTPQCAPASGQYQLRALGSESFPVDFTATI